jgi:hypothetical protein
MFFVENLLSKELKAAQSTRQRFYQDKGLNVTAGMAQAAEHNDHELYVVSKIRDAWYNEQEMFHELLVAWRCYTLERPFWNHTQLWLWLSGDNGKVKGVSRRHRHGLRDAFSLRVLMGKCYALLRMRTLSISFAEGFLVISCGNVEYDKSVKLSD